MRHRILGKTGIRVSEIGLGGLFVSTYGSERDEGIRAVRRGLELGINYVDTAPSYSDSEEVMGQAWKGWRNPTSFRPNSADGRNPSIPGTRNSCAAPLRPASNY